MGLEVAGQGIMGRGAKQGGLTASGVPLRQVTAGSLRLLSVGQGGCSPHRPPMLPPGSSWLSVHQPDTGSGYACDYSCDTFLSVSMRLSRCSMLGQKTPYCVLSESSEAWVSSIPFYR